MFHMILQDFYCDPARGRNAFFFHKGSVFFLLTGNALAFKRNKMFLVVIVEVGILGKHGFFPRMAGKILSTMELGIVFCRVLMKNYGKIYPQGFIHSPQGGVDDGLVHKVELFELWINGFAVVRANGYFR